MVCLFQVLHARANGSERQQVMPLIDRLLVKNNQPGRPRKRVKVVAADKGDDSKDLRAALRKVTRVEASPTELYENVVSNHSCQNAIGRQREIWADQLKYQSLVFKSSVASAWFQRKYRRLVVRWERISACFNAFVSLATIHIWINKILLVG
jgi:hypothetical protein